MKFTFTPVIVSHRAKSDLTYFSDLEVKGLSQSERFKNAIRLFIISLIAAAGFALIPVLHFVLVPASLLIGVYLFYQFYKFKNSHLQKNILCPDCRIELSLKARAFNWPIQIECQKCRSQIKIDKKAL